MRVALVAPLFESVPPKLYGGTERVIYNLCRGLRAAGIHTTLFASGDSTAPVSTVEVVKEALRLSQPPVIEPAAYSSLLLARVREQAGEFDVIHNHHDYWMLPLTEMTSTPVVTTLHGRLDLPYVRPLFSAFPQASYVAISDRQRAEVPSLNWVRTIHHGIAVSDFEFHPQPGKYLAFLGRIHPEKRPEWAIQIAKESGVPLKIAAKIEGEQGRQYYDTFVRPHVDGRFIEYVGEITEQEKSDFLGNALATVFPIDWPEPFGLVVLESLACGTPVLTRPCGSMPELLRNGVTGYLSPDLGTLARRVRKIPSLDRARCREWVARRFSIERMTEDHINVYRSLVGVAPASERNAGRRSHHHRRDLLYPLQRTADGNT